MSSARRLEGARVLVTRPKERAEELCFLLEDEGAEVLLLPLLELQPATEPRALQAAAEQIHRWRWVVFASPSAVQALVEACRQAGTLERLAKLQVGAVGPATARAARGSGLPVTREADGRGGRALFEAIKDSLSPTDEVLLPVAEDGRRELGEALDELGIPVSRVVAYRACGRELDGGELRRVLSAAPKAVLFGSPRTVEAYLEGTGSEGARLLERMVRVAIGPTTAEAMKELGYPAHAVAERPTAAALVDAVAKALS